MNMLDVREAQAALAARVWTALTDECGLAVACAVLSRAVTDDAMAAGRAFAAEAADGPSLKHFSSILGRWQKGGALEIAGTTLTDSELSFTVTSCRYAQTYQRMGLEPRLGSILSCLRDEPFARGYSPYLSMRRDCTIMEGAPCCNFVFTWISRPSGCRSAVKNFLNTAS